MLSLYFLVLLAAGVAAALPVRLVYGCSPEHPVGTHHHVFSGGPHVPQSPTVGLYLQGQ